MKRITSLLSRGWNWVRLFGKRRYRLTLTIKVVDPRDLATSPNQATFGRIQGREELAAVLRAGRP